MRGYEKSASRFYEKENSVHLDFSFPLSYCCLSKYHKWPENTLRRGTHDITLLRYLSLDLGQAEANRAQIVID